MLCAMMRADGDKKSRFGKKRKPGVMDAWQILCTLQGHAIGRYHDGPVIPTQMIRKQRFIAGSNVVLSEPRNESVWCPTTAYGTWIMRQDGNVTITGNTKAKRRVTLSICGLGLLDESEIETIPDARIEPQQNALPAQPRKPSNAIGIENARPITSSIQNLPGFSVDGWREISGLKVHELPKFVEPVLHAICQQGMPLERIRKALQWLKRESLDMLGEADCQRLYAAINKPAPAPVAQPEEQNDAGIVEDEV